MRYILLVLSIVLCSLTYAQRRPPQRQPDNASFQFPKEQDIIFPNPQQSAEEQNQNILYKIHDFQYSNYGNLPKRHRNRHRQMSPFKPGQPFPPPPNGRWNKRRKNRRGERRRLCERSECVYE